MYGAWDAMKNVDKVLPNHKLNWAAFVSGKRESRRLLGDIVLSKKDVMESIQYDDGCVPTGWKIDLHLPDRRYEKGFEGDAFISYAEFTDFPQPYWIPYRCSTRAAHPTCSWPAAISALPTKHSAPRESCERAAAWARSSAWPPRSARSTKPPPAVSTNNTWTNSDNSCCAAQANPSLPPPALKDVGAMPR